MTGLLTHLTSIRWQDAVDIIINSYILFRLYVLFKDTNAFRILVGIASLWIIQEIAASLGLILTSWALQGITAAAAVIIVVVFRNEIRSALQIRNLKAFLWGSPLAETVSPAEIITDAIYQMGKKRIGALIVFPGKEDLRELVHGGIPWDGKVSQEMIMSIFWPKNPVHDGAIIIRGDRIVEVGVLLPLSQRKDLPTYYGTRHRAAAGLAERSDALVVAVSEERGRVTVAKNHWIRPVAQAEELQQIIREHLMTLEPVQNKKTSKEWLKLSVAAILSFPVMTGIWYGFTRSKETIIALTVPIEYVNLPANYEILKTSVNEVHLQLNGSSVLIKSLRPEQVAVQIDLSKGTLGTNEFPITKDNIVLPPGVLLSKVDPPTVTVILDTPITKELPVQVDWRGKLPEGLILSKVTINPSTIRVIGSSTILKKIDTIYTVPVKLDNFTQSGSLTVPLLITPASIRLADTSPDHVTINYIIVRRKRNSLAHNPS